MNFYAVCVCLIFLSAAQATVIIMRPYPRRSSREFARQFATNSTKSINTHQPTEKNTLLPINALALFFDSVLSKCHSQNDNILIAPINIVKTLSTVMLGTAGKTERELTNAIGLAFRKNVNSNFLGFRSIQEFHQALGQLLRKVTTEDPGVNFGTNLDIAGGVFVDAQHSIKSTFEQKARDIYLTQTYRLDFASDGQKSAEFINQWVSNKTHGKIKDIVGPSISSLTKVIIAGALYFNGNWESPFYEKFTKWQPFYTSSKGKYGNESVLVEVMVNQGRIPYYENMDIGYQAIGIPYKNKEVYMYVVLPRLQLSLRNLLCHFSNRDIQTIVRKSKTTEVFYVIPKMKLSYETNLKDSLQKLNVKTLFDPQTANFSNLGNGLYASDIIHKVEMDINEIGTTAAATTTVSVNRGGYINFRADRSFAFFIYNAKADIMTFWGSIHRPTPFKLRAPE